MVYPPSTFRVEGYLTLPSRTLYTCSLPPLTTYRALQIESLLIHCLNSLQSIPIIYVAFRSPEYAGQMGPYFMRMGLFLGDVWIIEY